MSTSDPHLVHTGELGEAASMLVRHPYNPRSEVRIWRLGDPTGLSRIGISLGRIAPGRESFVPHAHMRDEEFVFILGGRGEALIGGARHTVGPGDFMGFPTDGVAHHLINSGTEDLVYLMGGERSLLDVGVFPTLRKIGLSYAAEGTMRLYDTDKSETRPFTDWIARDTK